MEQIAGFTCDLVEVAPGLRLWLRRGESLDATVVAEVIDRDGYRVKGYNMHGWTVVDCGAHVGVFTALCMARGAARVLAVEPQPQNRAILARNVEDWLAVDVAPYALGGEARTTRITWVSGGAHVCPPEAGKAMQPEWPAEQTTLAWMLDNYGVAHVDLLKLDMEGAEVETLLACPADVLARVDRVVAETHGTETHPWCVRDPREIVAHLAPLFDVELVGSPEGYGKLYATRKGL